MGIDKTMPVIPQQSKNISSLDWLVGKWTGKQGETLIGERWAKTDSMTLTGSGFMIKGSDTIITEITRMVATDSATYFVPNVAENEGEVFFRLISSDSGRFVFENPTHNFPTRVIYLQVGSDSLYARIEGISKGKEKGIDYIYSRLGK